MDEVVSRDACNPLLLALVKKAFVLIQFYRALEGA